MFGPSTHRRWLVIFASTFLSALSLVTTVNVVVDPHGLFHLIAAPRFNLVKRYVSSDRMTKVYYLARLRPRTLLFGSSTMGSFDPSDLQRYAPSPAYNLALGSAHIREIHAYLMHAASRYPVSTAVIGLDFSSFFPHDARTEIHPGFAAGRLSMRLFVGDYLDSLFSSDALLRSLNTVRDNLAGQPRGHFIDYETGVFIWNPTYSPQERRSLDAYRIEHLCKVYATPQRSRILENITYLKQLAEFADARNIAVRFFISPSHISSFDVIYGVGLGALYARWQRAMADVVPYYDFNGPNTINNDPENFVDTLHLKPEGGRLIFARLFSDKSIAVPPDFGVLVTRSNVDAHLREMESLHSLIASAIRPPRPCAPRG